VRIVEAAPVGHVQAPHLDAADGRAERAGLERSAGPSWPFAKPGMFGKPICRSSIGSRLAIATPFHWLRPCASTV
jgi:hypothetical protein